MCGISRSVLYSAGPCLPRPSIFIHLFFILAIDSRCFSGGCWRLSTHNYFGCGNPACITQLNSGVLVYVVHAVGYFGALLLVRCKAI